MLLRCALLLAVCSLAGCNDQPGSTALAASEPVSFSPEPGVRAGNVRVRPAKLKETAGAAEWQWRIKGSGLPGGAKFYQSRIDGNGPINVTLQISGAVEVDARVLLRLKEESGQVRATQRVEVASGQGMGKVQEKTWTVPGTLADAVKIEHPDLTEHELPTRVTLAKVGPTELTLNLEQSSF